LSTAVTVHRPNYYGRRFKRFIDGFLEGGAKDVSVGGDPKGTDSDALFWVNERLTAAVKAPAGEGQNFYDELPY
jgi:hypothetical protein